MIASAFICTIRNNNHNDNLLYSYVGFHTYTYKYIHALYYSVYLHEMDKLILSILLLLTTGESIGGEIQADSIVSKTYL